MWCIVVIGSHRGKLEASQGHYQCMLADLGLAHLQATQTLPVGAEGVAQAFEMYPNRSCLCVGSLGLRCFCPLYNSNSQKPIAMVSFAVCGGGVLWEVRMAMTAVVAVPQ